MSWIDELLIAPLETCLEAQCFVFATEGSQPPTKTFLATNRARIIELAVKHRLAAIYPTTPYPDAGGLMSYGPAVLDNWRRDATYVDKILKGDKAGELPVQQPMKFEFVVNLKTAKQIAVTTPPNVLMRADRVIR